MGTICHASHGHPLVLCSNKRKIHGAACYGCKLCVRGEAYECVSCKLCLHKACVEELPSVIQQHPLHPSHPLTLFHHSPYGPIGFKCHNCQESESYNAFSYQCSKCQFSLDVECAMDCLFVTDTDHQQQMITKRDKHQHPLTKLLDVRSDDGIVCNGCRLHIQDRVAYACRICKFFIHISCLDLPEEMNILHFDKSTTFLLDKEEGSSSPPICGVCKDDFNGFMYIRESMQVGLCCAFLKPQLKVENLHKHPLVFIEKKVRGIKCNACRDRCYSQIFRCVECNFNLHFSCAPVVSTIVHECHIDPLTLKKLDNEDETEEYYCDACETRRNPNPLVYYCEQCDFAVHIDCLLPEVLDSSNEGSSMSQFDEESNIPLAAVVDLLLMRYQDDMEELSEKIEKLNAKLQEINDSKQGRHHDHIEELSEKIEKLTCRESSFKLDQEIDLVSREIEKLTYEQKKLTCQRLGYVIDTVTGQMPSLLNCSAEDAENIFDSCMKLLDLSL